MARSEREEVERILEEACAALEGVIAVADRNTPEFRRARAALASARPYREVRQHA
jgi:hypothetical protein